MGSTGGGSSDMLGISYTDYASIKNGSYGKLVSAYYKKVETEDGKSSSSSTIKDSKEKLNSINDAAGKLADSADKLLNKGRIPHLRRRRTVRVTVMWTMIPMKSTRL